MFHTNRCDVGFAAQYYGGGAGRETRRITKATLAVSRDAIRTREGVTGSAWVVDALGADCAAASRTDRWNPTGTPWAAR